MKASRVNSSDHRTRPPRAGAREDSETSERVLVTTGNPNFVPSVILLGAFLVPVVFVTYLYERLPDWEVPLGPLATCFIWGGP